MNKQSALSKIPATTFGACIAALIVGASILPLHADHHERRITLYDGTGIVQIAEQYLGTPYKPGGITPSGFDCSGFTSFVFKQAGYSLSRTADGQFDQLNPVRQPEVGDLVFFRISGSKVSHVGIYVGDLKFIHSPSSGKTVSYADMRISYWKTRYAGSRSVFQY